MKTQDVAPELKPFFNLMHPLIGKYDVARIFDDFLTIAIGQFHLPAHLNPTFDEVDHDFRATLARYTEREREVFAELVREYFRMMIRELVPPAQAQLLVKDVRLGVMAVVNAVYTHNGNLLMQDVGSKSGLFSEWHDALGNFYMELTSRYKSGRLGQFFTPSEICKLMAALNMTEFDTHDSEGRPYSPNNRRSFNEPCCGSGAMALAAHARDPGNTFMVLQDIDPICCKMTTLNCLMHGVPCEVWCGDALWPDAKNFRFAYRLNRWLHSHAAPEEQLQMMPHFRKITAAESCLFNQHALQAASGYHGRN